MILSHKNALFFLATLPIFSLGCSHSYSPLADSKVDRFRYEILQRPVPSEIKGECTVYMNAPTGSVRLDKFSCVRLQSAGLLKNEDPFYPLYFTTFTNNPRWAMMDLLYHRTRATAQSVDPQKERATWIRQLSRGQCPMLEEIDPHQINATPSLSLRTDQEKAAFVAELVGNKSDPLTDEREKLNETGNADRWKETYGYRFNMGNQWNGFSVGSSENHRILLQNGDTLLMGLGAEIPVYCAVLKKTSISQPAPVAPVVSNPVQPQAEPSLPTQLRFESVVLQRVEKINGNKPWVLIFSQKSPAEPGKDTFLLPAQASAMELQPILKQLRYKTPQQLKGLSFEAPTENISGAEMIAYLRFLYGKSKGKYTPPSFDRVHDRVAQSLANATCPRSDALLIDPISFAAAFGKAPTQQPGLLTKLMDFAATLGKGSPQHSALAQKIKESVRKQIKKPNTTVVDETDPTAFGITQGKKKWLVRLDSTTGLSCTAVTAKPTPAKKATAKKAARAR